MRILLLAVMLVGLLHGWFQLGMVVPTAGPGVRMMGDGTPPPPPPKP